MATTTRPTRRTGSSHTSTAIAALPTPPPVIPVVHVDPTPVVTPPPIAPFLTADDILQVANLNFNSANSEADVNRQLSDLTTDTKYAKTQNEDVARKNTAAAAENAAARGIFQSSIKDAALYDIAAQKAIRQGQLDDHLHTAQVDADRRKQLIRAQLEAAAAAMQQRAVENAAAANANQPAPVPDRAAADAANLAAQRQTEASRIANAAAQTVNRPSTTGPSDPWAGMRKTPWVHPL